MRVEIQGLHDFLTDKDCDFEFGSKLNKLRTSLEVFLKGKSNYNECSLVYTVYVNRICV